MGYDGECWIPVPLAPPVKMLSDLDNMRMNGVRSLCAWCLDCGHDGTVNVDHLPGHLAVPAFVMRMEM